MIQCANIVQVRRCMISKVLQLQKNFISKTAQDLIMGFSRQEYWSGLPFPSPVDHILSDLSTMTRPSWVAPQAWLSFIELDKAVVHVIRLTSFLWLWFVCLPSDASGHLPSYLGFSYLGRGVSLHGCSSKAQPLLLTLDEGYLLTAAPPDLERGIAPLTTTNY